MARRLQARQDLYSQQLNGPQMTSTRGSEQALRGPVNPIANQLLQSFEKMGLEITSILAKEYDAHQVTKVDEALARVDRQFEAWSNDYLLNRQGELASNAMEDFANKYAELCEPELEQFRSNERFGNLFRERFLTHGLHKLQTGANFQRQQTLVWRESQLKSQEEIFARLIDERPEDIDAITFEFKNLVNSIQAKFPGHDNRGRLLQLQDRVNEARINALIARGDYAGAQAALDNPLFAPMPEPASYQGAAPLSPEHQNRVAQWERDGKAADYAQSIIDEWRASQAAPNAASQAPAAPAQGSAPSPNNVSRETPAAPGAPSQGSAASPKNVSQETPAALTQAPQNVSRETSAAPAQAPKNVSRETAAAPQSGGDPFARQDAQAQDEFANLIMSNLDGQEAGASQQAPPNASQAAPTQAQTPAQSAPTTPASAPSQSAQAAPTQGQAPAPAAPTTPTGAPSQSAQANVSSHGEASRQETPAALPLSQEELWVALRDPNYYGPAADHPLIKPGAKAGRAPSANAIRLFGAGKSQRMQKRINAGQGRGPVVKATDFITNHLASTKDYDADTRKFALSRFIPTLTNDPREQGLLQRHGNGIIDSEVKSDAIQIQGQARSLAAAARAKNPHDEFAQVLRIMEGAAGDANVQAMALRYNFDNRDKKPGQIQQSPLRQLFAYLGEDNAELVYELAKLMRDTHGKPEAERRKILSHGVDSLSDDPYMREALLGACEHGLAVDEAHRMSRVNIDAGEIAAQVAKSGKDYRGQFELMASLAGNNPEKMEAVRKHLATSAPALLGANFREIARQIYMGKLLGEEQIRAAATQASLDEANTQKLLDIVPPLSDPKFKQDSMADATLAGRKDRLKPEEVPTYTAAFDQSLIEHAKAGDYVPDYRPINRRLLTRDSHGTPFFMVRNDPNALSRWIPQVPDGYDTLLNQHLQAMNLPPNAYNRRLLYREVIVKNIDLEKLAKWPDPDGFKEILARQPASRFRIN